MDIADIAPQAPEQQTPPETATPAPHPEEPRSGVTNPHPEEPRSGVTKGAPDTAATDPITCPFCELAAHKPGPDSIDIVEMPANQAGPAARVQAGGLAPVTDPAFAVHCFMCGARGPAASTREHALDLWKLATHRRHALGAQTRAGAAEAALQRLAATKPAVKVTVSATGAMEARATAAPALPPGTHALYANPVRDPEPDMWWNADADEDGPSESPEEWARHEIDFNGWEDDPDWPRAVDFSTAFKGPYVRCLIFAEPGEDDSAQTARITVQRFETADARDAALAALQSGDGQ